jgi:type II secretory pathway component PulK
MDLVKDNNNGKTFATFLASTGILSILAAGMLSVASDARIAIQVAEQHGQEILLLRGELNALREELRERTRERYTESDHLQFQKYIEERIERIEQSVDKHLNK